MANQYTGGLEKTYEQDFGEPLKVFLERCQSQGMTTKQTSDKLGCHKSLLWKYLKRYNLASFRVPTPSERIHRPAKAVEKPKKISLSFITMKLPTTNPRFLYANSK